MDRGPGRPAGPAVDHVVVIVDGRRLAPPRRPGDCACVFCSTFRTQHLVVRALLMALVVAAASVFTWDVWSWADEEQINGGGAVVGGLLLVLTMLVVLAVAAWYQPIRRALHRSRPRTTLWPPRPIP